MWNTSLVLIVSAFLTSVFCLPFPDEAVAKQQVTPYDPYVSIGLTIHLDIQIIDKYQEQHFLRIQRRQSTQL